MRSNSGHFGHLELAKPMIHVGFLPAILKILRCVCYHCSKILVDESNKKFREVMKIKKPSKRLHALLQLCQNLKVCNGGEGLDEGIMNEDGEKDGEPSKRSGCGNPLPKYVRDGIKLTVTFAAGDVDGGDRKKSLLGSKIHEIFRRISDSDCQALGFNPEFARPDWFIMTVLPISPPPVR
jgi:DNA-directed RNA polymerase II subunit RPB1